MMNLKYIFRALSAEMLKLKRTVALRVAVIAPMVVVVVMSLVYHQRQPLGVTGTDLWLRFSQEVLGLWALLMLPLFVTLEAALLGALESAEKNWKHLFALPIPRGAIYAAKIITTIGIIGLSKIVLLLGAMAAGMLLGLLKPDYQLFLSAFPFRQIARMYLTTYFLAWLMITIQMWVSVRWQSFTVSVSTGISATVFGYMLINSQKWGKIYPWTLPVNVLAQNGNVTRALLISLIGGLIIAVLGGLEFIRRDVA
jgi:lantibiotic transport system permease protein